MSAVTAGAKAAAFGIASTSAAAAFGMSKLKSMATLYIRDMDVDDKVNASAGLGSNADISALKTLKKRRNKSSSKLGEAAGQLVPLVGLTVDRVKMAMGEAELDMMMSAKDYRGFEVQYNPASLRMNTVGGTVVKYSAMGNENMNSIYSTDKKTSTYLSVQLIFEDINISDAFGSSTLSLDASSMINMGESIATNLFGGGYGVRTQVEGIISLLMTKRTRQIIFVWSDMFFHGEILSVDANYTMFNKTGSPIRATVDIQIQQTASNATFASDNAYWNDAFDAAFTAKNSLTELL